MGGGRFCVPCLFQSMRLDSGVPPVINGILTRKHLPIPLPPNNTDLFSNFPNILNLCSGRTRI